MYIPPASTALAPKPPLTGAAIPPVATQRPTVVSGPAIIPPAIVNRDGMPIAPPATNLIPVAASVRDLKPPSAASAFAQGLVTSLGAAQAQREEEYKAQTAKAEDEARRKQAAAALLEQYPDQPGLARLIEVGGLTPDAAIGRATDAAELAQKLSERTQVSEYLRSINRDDLADAYDARAIDEDGVAASLKGKEPKDAPSGYRWGADGATLEKIPGGPADKPAEEAGFNVSQATAAGFADRMIQSDALIAQPELAAVQTDRSQQIKSGTPFFGNDLVSSEYRRATQAQSDFINALMRRESGAVIGQDEFDRARDQYFPQPGDDKFTLDQKAANRRNAITGVTRSAGPAYQPPDTTNYLTGDLDSGTDEVAQPQSAADYDALPSGAMFIDPDDGKTYQKP